MSLSVSVHVSPAKIDSLLQTSGAEGNVSACPFEIMFVAMTGRCNYIDGMCSSSNLAYSGAPRLL